MRYYEIAPNRIVRAGSDRLTYSSESALETGTIVTIPVGKSTAIGLVLGAVKKPSYPTKPVSSVLYDQPLPAALVRSLLWLADYYATPLASVIQTALPRGLTTKRRKSASAPEVFTRDRTNYLFNKFQQKAIKKISTTPGQTTILHGVTGSGKTAVYLELIRRSLEAGKSSILIVPEIALTSQLVAELQHDFAEGLLVTHSRQTEADRHLTWLEALNANTPKVAVGPRSALFLPLADVGTIVIDEAHEPSLKQDSSPKYSALRLASTLGKLHHAQVVQGSATPLVSEYYIAKNYGAVATLPEKARPTKPTTVTLIDMTKRSNFSRHKFLSDPLLKQIEANLEVGRQTLIFHNRRGSASTTLCQSCGWSALCPNCYLPLSLHIDRHRLRCHVCNYTAPVPTNCPVCSSTDIIHKGIGTKLIESELSRLYPEAKISRYDADSAASESLDREYDKIYRGEIDIIIGTQVVAKGLDLPHLETVGVVQADAGLSLPDYSASERTFQLLAQAIGRVGRDEQASSAIIQSYQPTSSAVRYGIVQDYQSFYDETLTERKRAGYPPYCFMLRLVCSYRTEATAVKNSQALAHELRQKHPDVQILGPTPAFHERTGGNYRWQIVAKSKSRSKLVEIVHSLPPKSWQFDLDPYSLL